MPRDLSFVLGLGLTWVAGSGDTGFVFDFQLPARQDLHHPEVATWLLGTAHMELIPAAMAGVRAFGVAWCVDVKTVLKACVWNVRCGTWKDTVACNSSFPQNTIPFSLEDPQRTWDFLPFLYIISLIVEYLFIGYCSLILPWTANCIIPISP